MSLGQLWLELLRFYTLEFSLEEHIISIRLRQLLSREAKSWPRRRLAIEGESRQSGGRGWLPLHPPDQSGGRGFLTLPPSDPIRREGLRSTPSTRQTEMKEHLQPPLPDQ